jgi:hypothetical protein
MIATGLLRPEHQLGDVRVEHLPDVVEQRRQHVVQIQGHLRQLHRSLE